MKKGSVIHRFPGSNTTEGFYPMYKEGLRDMARVFILKGGPGTGKSTLMKKIAGNLTERGYDVEMWQCSSDNESVDGVIVRALQIAVVDGTAPHTVDPVYPGAVDEIINLGDHWNREMLAESREDIVRLTEEISENFQQAYEMLAEYKVLYDDFAMENSVGEKRITSLANDVICDVFGYDLSEIKHFFASAVTPNGWVGYNQELSADVRRRFVIKSANRYDVHLFLRQIEDAAVLRGHDIDIYHSTFAPDCYEMIVLPRIGFAFVDGSAPDLRSLPQDQTVEISAVQAADSQRRQKLEQAVNYIAKAKSLHNDLEDYYVKAMNFDEIDEVCKKVFAEIWQMADEWEKSKESKQ